MNTLFLSFLFFFQVFGSEIQPEEDIFFSYAPDWLVQFISPEGAKMLEKLNRQPRSKEVSLRLSSSYYGKYDCNQDTLHLILNYMSLSETDSEDEPFKFTENDPSDMLTIHCHNSELDVVQAETYDLNEKLFEAAVETFNIYRLNKLINRNKHLLLSSEMKARTMKRALLACRYPGNTETCGEIFKTLIIHGFYPENNELGNIDRSDDSEYPFYGIVRDPRLYGTFLDYDKDIFAKQIKINYISKYIKNAEYRLAITALSLGFNPHINEEGKDALDKALEEPIFILTVDEKVQRQKLIKILQKDDKINLE